jgi:hypothetical protein
VANRGKASLREQPYRTDAFPWGAFTSVPLMIVFFSRFLLCLALLTTSARAHESTTPRVKGVVWQLHDSSPRAEGRWHRLGVEELLLQWVAVDGVTYVQAPGFVISKRIPDWARIRKQPWAKTVIVGLSGRFSESRAREELQAVTAESVALSQAKFPFRVTGWYFPIEVDPTWREAPKLMPAALNRLPRPLWISVYDRANIGPENLATWISSWLPPDVGVFFQDGVGVWARTPPVAREYADQLVKRLGKRRVRVIAEAFRAGAPNSFRAATAPELKQQLQAYRGHSIYLFDAPHYVSNELVDALLIPQ